MSSVGGNWDMTLHAPQEELPCVIAINAAAPSGTLVASTGPEAEMLDLVIDGDTLSWRARITKPMPLMVEFTATVDGDQMTGTATAASIIKIPFDGTRA
jgi:hypothetical protein